jgi:hypothetical protein
MAGQNNPMGADGNKTDGQGEDFTQKSATEQIGIEELEKSLTKLEDIAKSSGQGRKDALLVKAQTPEGLSDDEKAELIKSLGGGTEPGIAQTVTKSLAPAENDELAKSVNVTPYLDELNTAIHAYCTDLAEVVEKSQTRQDEMSLVLVKGVADIGKTVIAQARLIKSLQDRLDTFGREPARAPRAQTSMQQVVQKSFAGSQPGEEQLSKSEVMDLLEDMHKSSIAQGNKGAAMCGEDLNTAITKLENGDLISDALRQEVVQFRRSRMNGAH